MRAPIAPRTDTNLTARDGEGLLRLLPSFKLFLAVGHLIELPAYSNGMADIHPPSKDDVKISCDVHTPYASLVLYTSACSAALSQILQIARKTFVARNWSRQGYKPSYAPFTKAYRGLDWLFALDATGAKQGHCQS
jgi:hypothetical protein